MPSCKYQQITPGCDIGLLLIIKSMSRQFSHHIMIGGYIRAKYGLSATWEMQKTVEKNKKATYPSPGSLNKYAMFVMVDGNVIAKSPDYEGGHKHGWYESKWGEILASVELV